MDTFQVQVFLESTCVLAGSSSSHDDDDDDDDDVDDDNDVDDGHKKNEDVESHVLTFDICSTP